VIDGEAVVLGVDGISDFNALHSRKHDHEFQLYAFGCLAYNGDDLGRLPLHLRKTNLAQLLRGRAEGIFVAPFEQGEIGPDLFEVRVGWGWRAWSPSIVSASTGQAAATTGSRSRTGNILPLAASRTSSRKRSARRI
jgi:bifunctional non-homologous end joining protein LigD